MFYLLLYSFQSEFNLKFIGLKMAKIQGPFGLMGKRNIASWKLTTFWIIFFGPSEVPKCLIQQFQNEFTCRTRLRNGCLKAKRKKQWSMAPFPFNPPFWNFEKKNVRQSVRPFNIRSSNSKRRLSIYEEYGWVFRQSVIPSVRLSVCPSVHQPVSPSIRQSGSPSVHLSVSPSVITPSCISDPIRFCAHQHKISDRCPSVRPSSVGQCISPSVRQSVNPSIRSTYDLQWLWWEMDVWKPKEKNCGWWCHFHLIRHFGILSPSVRQCISLSVRQSICLSVRQLLLPVVFQTQYVFGTTFLVD
jgi:hypothetical protein